MPLVTNDLYAEVKEIRSHLDILEMLSSLGKTETNSRTDDHENSSLDH